MIIELGHFALILALVTALIQGVAPFIGIARGDDDLIALAHSTARMQFALVTVAFIALTYGFVTDDFTVRYVAEHSNTNLPLYYKFSALWSAHEGSLLLWALILSLWTFAVSEMSSSLPRVFVARVLAVMGLIAIGFLLFTLATSNPFERLFPAPFEGRDLNPLLQDPGLTIHPPMIYMGYVGFSVAFAFAIAALLDGKLSAQWARWSRPWTLIAWVFLTLGIGLGSWWAYNELGWGGWWFWDPVENASFMPWLVGTALIHSLAVAEKRDAFKSWTIFLALLAFSLSLLGTFLVRSGVLVSVHAFATDPTRGVFILAFLTIVIGSALVLYALRAPTIKSSGIFSLVSRESGLLVNNVILVATMFTILIATLYPLVLDALGMDKISVGAPYFNAVFIPLMLPLVFLAGLGPHIKWQKDQLKNWLPYLSLLILAFVLALVIMLYFVDSNRFSISALIGLSAGIWLSLAMILFLFKAKSGTRRITSAYLGMSIAHIGIAIFVLGTTLNGIYSEEKITQTGNQNNVELAGYQFTLHDVINRTGQNYSAQTGEVRVSYQQQPIATLYPEKRVYMVQKSPMTEASIHTTLFYDLYVSLGDQLDDGRWTLRVYYRPFMQWIWIAVLLIALGGIVAVFDKRYRRQV